MGSLGTLQFPDGFYAYVGSAQGDIEQRVARHRSREKRIRWHIDYLLAKAEGGSVISMPFGGKGLECMIATVMDSVRDGAFHACGFGSSDCRCVSHLVYLGRSDDAETCLECVLFRMCTIGVIHPYVVGA